MKCRDATFGLDILEDNHLDWAFSWHVLLNALDYFYPDLQRRAYQNSQWNLRLQQIKICVLDFSS